MVVLDQWGFWGIWISGAFLSMKLHAFILASKGFMEDTQ